MANRPSSQPAILPRAPLLVTESKDEFKRIRDALAYEINPRGILEQMYVEDIAYLVWEILRLRRAKASIINAAFRDALRDVLDQCLREPAYASHTGDVGERFVELLKARNSVGAKAGRLADEWFTHASAKEEVAKILRSFDLDETAIEGEAVRKSADDVERIDRLMASAEARRDKALVCIAQYRGDFGALLRESSNRLVGEKVLQLENTASKQQKSAAA
jgi:hypothetical protein